MSDQTRIITAAGSTSTSLRSILLDQQTIRILRVAITTSIGGYGARDPELGILRFSK